MYSSRSSQSALSTMTASDGASPKPRYLSKTCWMPALLWAMSSSDSSLRASSLNDGSPIFEVPPPISTIGLWPVFCIQRSSMICSSEPMCRLSAVQSKPM